MITSISTNISVWSDSTNKSVQLTGQLPVHCCWWGYMRGDGAQLTLTSLLPVRIHVWCRCTADLDLTAAGGIHVWCRCTADLDLTAASWDTCVVSLHSWPWPHCCRWDTCMVSLHSWPWPHCCQLGYMCGVAAQLTLTSLLPVGYMCGVAAQLTLTSLLPVGYMCGVAAQLTLTSLLPVGYMCGVAAQLTLTSLLPAGIHVWSRRTADLDLTAASWDTCVVSLHSWPWPHCCRWDTCVVSLHSWPWPHCCQLGYMCGVAAQLTLTSLLPVGYMCGVAAQLTLTSLLPVGIHVWWRRTAAWPHLDLTAASWDTCVVSLHSWPWPHCWQLGYMCGVAAQLTLTSLLTVGIQMWCRCTADLDLTAASWDTCQAGSTVAEPATRKRNIYTSRPQRNGQMLFSNVISWTKADQNIWCHLVSLNQVKIQSYILRKTKWYEASCKFWVKQRLLLFQYLDIENSIALFQAHKAAS